MKLYSCCVISLFYLLIRIAVQALYHCVKRLNIIIIKKLNNTFCFSFNLFFSVCQELTCLDVIEYIQFLLSTFKMDSTMGVSVNKIKDILETKQRSKRTESHKASTHGNVTEIIQDFSSLEE